MYVLCSFTSENELSDDDDDDDDDEYDSYETTGYLSCVYDSLSLSRSLSLSLAIALVREGIDL